MSSVVREKPELQSVHRNLGWRPDSTKGSKAAGHEKSQKYYRVTLFFIFQNSSSGSPAENATGNKQKAKKNKAKQKVLREALFGVCNYSIPLSVFFFLFFKKKVINKQTNLGRFCRGGFLSVWTWSSGPSVLDSPFFADCSGSLRRVVVILQEHRRPPCQRRPSGGD